jgi:hypothetical protein
MWHSKQVILDNGRGQGTFGTGCTWAAAAQNARNFWKVNAFAGKPVRVRLVTQTEAREQTIYRSEMSFPGWAALVRELAELDDAEALAEMEAEGLRAVHDEIAALEAALGERARWL